MSEDAVPPSAHGAQEIGCVPIRSPHVLPPARHEIRDAPFPLIAAGFALLIGMIGGIAMFVLWLFPTSATDRTIVPPIPAFPAPRLQPDPRFDMQNFYAREMQRLNSVGWVDRAHGQVHIPIAEAMRLLAQRGIPDWPAPPKAAGK